MSKVGGLKFGGAPPNQDLSFTDTGSVDIGAQTFVGGLCVLEVIDATANGITIGGAIVVVENDQTGGPAWAGIIGSTSRAAGPSPVFSIVGSSVRVATAAGSGHRITVLGRRPLHIDFTVSG